LRYKNMSAQQMWINAITTFHRDNILNLNTIYKYQNEHKHKNDVDIEILSSLIVHNISMNKHLLSVPRKLHHFLRYCVKNRKSLVPSIYYLSNARRSIFSHKFTISMLNTAAEYAYNLIAKKKYIKPQTPKPSRDEDSAWGQIRLLLLHFVTKWMSDRINNNLLIMKQYDQEICILAQRYKLCKWKIFIDYTLNNMWNYDSDRQILVNRFSQLFVVHRLDCATSGIMVFARTHKAASILSQIWRYRNVISKIYLARVPHWPPFHLHNQSSGKITLRLRSRKERLKWEAITDSDDFTDGKESITVWNVVETKNQFVDLCLIPITGRTHQLRIHCIETGCCIVGDSLYGHWPDNLDEVSIKPNNGNIVNLHLHAYKLSFPHPETKVSLVFEEPRSW